MKLIFYFNTVVNLLRNSIVFKKHCAPVAVTLMGADISFQDKYNAAASVTFMSHYFISDFELMTPFINSNTDVERKLDCMHC